MKRILFVCTGNICRSPTAEGVARHLALEMGLANRFEFDSAGTHAYHTGEAPDKRAQHAARKRDYDLSGLRARTVVSQDFEHFDFILAMDREHLDCLQQACPQQMRHKLSLFMNSSSMHANFEIEDPYYGSPAGFERVLDQCEEVLCEMLSQLR